MTYAVLAAIFAVALVAQAALHRSVVAGIVAEAAKERHRLVSSLLARTPAEAAVLIRAGEREPKPKREHAEVIHPEGL